MTRAQARIHAAIVEFHAANGYAPTMREVMAMVGLYSTSTVFGHLDRLRRQGLVTWEPGVARTLRVVREDAES